MACRLADIVEKGACNNTFWAIFTEQHELWNNAELNTLALRWKDTLASSQSLEDTSFLESSNQKLFKEKHTSQLNFYQRFFCQLIIK